MVRGDLLQSWGTAQASRAGRSSEGRALRAWGVLGSGAGWHQVQSLSRSGEHVRGVHHLNNVPTCVRVCRCARVRECAELRTCANVQGPGSVQDFGHVQMCKASDVQGWGECASVQGFGDVQMCRRVSFCSPQRPKVYE